MRKAILIAPVALILMFIAVAFLAPTQTSEFLIGVERSRAGLDTQAVSINGDPWPYLEKGPEGAETILLLHGFGGDKDNWVRFAARLPEGYRVIIPDLPGFGETNRYWDQSYSIPEQARRLEDFIAYMDLESVHLVGHARIRSLGFVTNAGIKSPKPGELAEILANGGDNVLIPRTRDEFDALIEFASFEAPFIPWPVSNHVADLSIAEADFKEYVLGFLWKEPGAPLEPVLPQIAAPVFVLWGRHDRLIDVSTVDVIRELKPQATIVILEESGHLPILEEPNESAGHYADFLSANQ